MQHGSESYEPPPFEVGRRSRSGHCPTSGRLLVGTVMHGVVSCIQVLKCSTVICRDVHAAVRQLFPPTIGLLLAVGNNIP